MDVDSSGGHRESPEERRPSFAPGTIVSHYKIIENIGVGGMGEVYLADDTRLNRRVAIKFVSPQIAADPNQRARFMREVQAVAALNHENIVHIYEVAEYQNRAYCVMEYVEGRSLRDVIRENLVSYDDIVRIGMGIASGLEAAHSLGIVHRDVKPANIVLDRNGRVRILDFGLAKRSTDPDLTMVGSTLGTVSYMSPEQAQGKDADLRSDIFSFGIVLYHLTTRRLPFKRAFDAATLTAIVNDPPPPLTEYRPDALTGLQRIIDRLLEKKVDKRYQSMTEVRRDLEQLADDLRTGNTGPTPTPRKGRKTAIWIGVVVLVAINGAVGWHLLQSLRESKPTQPATSATTTQAEREQTLPPDTTTMATTPDTMSTDGAEDEEPAPIDSSSILAAMEAEQRTKALQDSINRLSSAMQEAERQREQQRVDDSIRQAKAIVPDEQPVEDVGEETASIDEPVDPGPTPEELAAARRDDSTRALAAIETFWRAVESQTIDGLRSAFPTMPDNVADNWKTFMSNAKNLDVTPNIRRLTLNDGAAEAM
ncbi:MAG: protein kinase, partial [candidate division Zixibacteria bacterium]|nr:protein kinase [candidate division Zixibacteria bacterium]